MFIVVYFKMMVTSFEYILISPLFLLIPSTFMFLSLFYTFLCVCLCVCVCLFTDHLGTPSLSASKMTRWGEEIERNHLLAFKYSPEKDTCHFCSHFKANASCMIKSDFKRGRKVQSYHKFVDGRDGIFVNSFNNYCNPWGSDSLYLLQISRWIS